MANSARCIGPGRAGRSLTAALRQRGWRVDLLGRADDVSGVAEGTDLVVLAVPDDAIAAVAAAIRPVPGTVVCHLAGSRGLDVLEPHGRRASLHPLASLPDGDTGATRLLAGTTFAVAGDPLARQVVDDLGGRAIDVPDEHRARYHAAAVVASNHLVVLAAQVERLAAAAGVPADAYWPLAGATLDNVARLGATAALTGPAARGDGATVQAHLDGIPDDERALYRALAREAARLAGRSLPELLEEPAP